MFFKLKRLKQRLSYYIGYMWSFFLYVAPGVMAADMFDQGKVKFGVLTVCFGFFMSISYFMVSREKQKRYHETQAALFELDEKMRKAGYK
ncbi:hypothetical protein [Weissella sagaensis]|uniref:hypothetical protein n=1 Tax=Weissella sagaensis TaxID=2559928 RepID=UPI001152E6DB|nr:hypothetical protein [Weissella sagaensis]QDJ58906.1 hypothetical protein EFA59_04930 [Weissella hellenica]